MPFKIRELNFLSVLIDRVCRLLATVRVAPLYWLCGRVAYLHVFHAISEKFVNFEMIFLYEPC